MSKYCVKCGQQLPDDAIFCDNCGTRVDVSPMISARESASQLTGRYVAGQNDPRPVKKSGSCLGKLIKIFIILAIVLALAFGALVFLEKIYHRTDSGLLPFPSSNSSQNSSSSSSNEQNPSSPPVTDNSSQQNPSTDTPQGILKPDGDPWFDEFLFYENDVYLNGVPEGAALQSAGYISGDWKYCITFNRTIEGEERIDEIGLAEISFTEGTATLILHPQYIRYGSHVDPENEDEVGYEPFTGTWDNEYIDLNSNETYIGLGPFYSFDGKDYVLGNIVVKKTGLFGDVLLIRP